MVSAITSASDIFFKKSDSARPALPKSKSLFRNILTILTQQERTRFGFLTMLDIIISIIDILSLAFLLWIIRYYIQPVENSSLSFLPSWILNKNSVVFIAVFFFVFTMKNLAAFFVTRAQNNFAAGVAVRISRNNLSNYQSAEFDEFINLDSSIHIRKIGFQPFEFCQYMLSGIQQIITQTCLIVTAIVAILFFNARLFFLLLLILLPPVIAVFYFIKKRLTQHKLQIKTSNQLSFQSLMDALKGYVEGNIYGKNNFFLRRFVDHRKKFSSHLFSSVTIQTLPGRLIEIFAIMGLFILIAIAKWTGDNDSGTLITIGAFMAAAYKIIPGIVKLVNTAGQIKAYEFSLTDISNIADETTGNPSKRVEEIQSIKFLKICFQYNGSPVISDLSFCAERGDFIGIAGRSGKGKTTLFNLLLGFLSPARGEILLNNMPLQKEDIKNFWPAVSYVRQQSFFIHDTILRNITLDEGNYDEQRLQYVLKISGLEDLIGSSTEGVYKIITENGKNISGGQQQRIALARALYKDANLILLDEPFNELDEASELSLLHHFKELANSGKIVALITHNKKALSFCNKIISLDEQ